jgi:hypothetical protein
MSYDDYDDEEFDEFEEWEYEEKEVTEKESFRDRVSIWDIVKLVLLFVYFAGIFLFFRFWNVFADWLAFGSEQLGETRLIYLTLLLFPPVAALFIVGLVKVSRTLFIPPKKAENAKK